MRGKIPGFLVGYARWTGNTSEIPSIKKEVGTYNEHEGMTYVVYFSEAQKNMLGAIPGLNLISGLSRIYDAFFKSNFKDNRDYEYYYTPENLLRYRVTQFTVGVLEITLVGGWIVHGVATAYFYATRSTTPYKGQRHAELV